MALLHYKQTAGAGTDKNDKIERVLQICTTLMRGGRVNKAQAAAEYGGTERSIQRDIDDIRAFPDRKFAQSGSFWPVICDRFGRGVRQGHLYVAAQPGKRGRAVGGGNAVKLQKEGPGEMAGNTQENRPEKCKTRPYALGLIQTLVDPCPRCEAGEPIAPSEEERPFFTQ